IVILQKKYSKVFSTFVFKPVIFFIMAVTPQNIIPEVEELKQGSGNDVTQGQLDAVKTDGTDLQNNKADKTALTDLATKSALSDLQNNKADKTALTDLATKPALSDLQNNKADKTALTDLATKSALSDLEARVAALEAV